LIVPCLATRRIEPALLIEAGGILAPLRLTKDVNSGR
jgi:hypothetical protein